MNLKKYVLYSPSQPAELAEFLQQENGVEFTPIKGFQAEDINALAANHLFDVEKFYRYFNRTPFNDEIAHTYSHLQLWQIIDKDNELDENGYALIAESAVRFSPHFQYFVELYIEKYPYDIIKLQRNGVAKATLNPEYPELGAVIYHNPAELDGYGCAFYLIKKSVIRQLLAQYQSHKPFWKADYFSLFYPLEKIVEITQFLGDVAVNIRSKLSPFFSIIIPVYNTEDYLAQCLDSVLMQDYPHYEIILVNDGSSDHCANIAFQYSQAHSNITFVNSRNQGVAAARNSAMKLATGNYLMFMDSDDYWADAHYLSQCHNLLEQQPQLDLVLTSYCTLSQQNGEYSRINNMDNLHQYSFGQDFVKDYYHLVKHSLYLGFPCIKIIKRDLIIENQLFFPKNKVFEDVYWSMELSYFIRRYAILPVQNYVYRIERNGSITRFVSPDSFLDLLDVTRHQIHQLELRKTTHSALYDGNVLFLTGLHQYILKSHNLLTDSQQAQVESKYQAYLKVHHQFLSDFDDH